MSTRRLLLPIALATLAAGCGTKGSSPPGVTAQPDASPSPATMLAERPYTLVVPTTYDAGTPTPLVVMMHGYGFDGATEEAYMQLGVAAQAHGFLYAYGNGSFDLSGLRFWNATDACCNLDHLPVDDVAYINAIREDIAKKYNVDPKRFFLVGHSNGGFMAHRYACDHAEQVAAIVSLAGAVWEDASRCKPSEPVAVAEAHGDLDSTILYDGGANADSMGMLFPYPSAHQTVATWATKDTCAQPLLDGGAITLATSLPAGNTQIERYAGCAGSSASELWTIHGAGHIPSFDTTWGETVWAFFAAHPKP